MPDKAHDRTRVAAWLGAATVGLLAAAFPAGCRSSDTPAKIDMSRLRDGVYEGETWKIVVAVHIRKGEMETIEVKKQFAPRKYTDALKPLLDEILAKQSLQVDDLTGATMSSRHLKRALADALCKAQGAAESGAQKPTTPATP